MKAFLFFLMSVGACVCFAGKEIRIDSIGFGQKLKLAGLVELPQGQKLNAKAPSKIVVFEKEKNRWVLTEEVDLNEFFSLTEMIRFQRPVQLKSDTSEIKIEASLYHCPKLGRGTCVIDDFEGLVKRDSAKMGSEIKLVLRGNKPI